MAVAAGQPEEGGGADGWDRRSHLSAKGEKEGRKTDFTRERGNGPTAQEMGREAGREREREGAGRGRGRILGPKPAQGKEGEFKLVFFLF
jgi:hypothetical protein